MTDANKIMDPQHFGSDLADIQIHIWMRLDTLEEVCTVGAQSSYFMLLSHTLRMLSAVLDSTNAVTSSMSSVGYRHDNPALTEKRVAQILSEARAAMNAVDAPPQTQVHYFSSYYDCFDLRHITSASVPRGIVPTSRRCRITATSTIRYPTAQLLWPTGFLCGWFVGLEFPARQLVESDYWWEQLQTISEDVYVRNVLMHLAH